MTAADRADAAHAVLESLSPFDTSGDTQRRVAFYTVTNARHFPGVVGLVNSLRLVGHTEPVFVTDAGLHDRQRALLETVATVVVPPNGLQPELAKPFGPALHPADVIVLLDADVLVVRPLSPLIDLARAGKLVLFENNIPDRFFEDWSELGLGTPRRSPYVIAGHYLGPRSLVLPMLEEIAHLQDGLDPAATYFGGGDLRDPYYFADQDLMNALLMTRIDPEVVVRLDGALSPVPPFAGYQRFGGMGCTGPNGVEPYVLHHILQKPWLSPIRRNLYVDLLREVLWHPRAPIHLDPRDVPLRLRPSEFRRVDQAWASGWATMASLARGEMAVRRRLVNRAKRIAARGSSATGG